MPGVEGEDVEKLVDRLFVLFAPEESFAVLEVLAGVPTVVFGFFAITCITPFLLRWEWWQVRIKDETLELSPEVMQDLAALKADAEDQAAFAQNLRRLLAHLDLDPGLEEPDPEGESEDDSEAEE